MFGLAHITFSFLTLSVPYYETFFHDSLFGSFLHIWFNYFILVRVDFAMFRKKERLVLLCLFFPCALVTFIHAMCEPTVLCLFDILPFI